MNFNDLPELGIGLTYLSGLEPILDHNQDLIDVLEIEPQTIWYQINSDTNHFKIDEDVFTKLKNLNFNKILHGIGFPVGGTKLPDLYVNSPILRMIDEFNAAWMSEHLSFNTVIFEEEKFNTGFLLPPKQTMEGVETAVKSIQYMKKLVNIPLAIETGVNYLQPRNEELNDGEFVNYISKKADCGILLDLHNLWANEQNGRQSVIEFMKQIPSDRVIEVHLAGGMEFEGYWLDAHSGPIPQEVFNIATKLIPKLPNLKCIIFELFPAYLPYFGIDGIRNQIKLLHKLWSLKTDNVKYNSSLKNDQTELSTNLNHYHDKISSPIEWEVTLGKLAIDHPISNSLASELVKDEGIKIYQKLIKEFRGSSLVETMKLTCRLLMLSLHDDMFQDFLEKFWRTHSPELFPSTEAIAFSKYLFNNKFNIKYLDEVSRFEHAVICTLLDDQTRIVKFNHDPIVILRDLSERKYPRAPREGKYEIKITPDDAISETLKEHLSLNSKDMMH